MTVFAKSRWQGARFRKGMAVKLDNPFRYRRPHCRRFVTKKAFSVSLDMELHRKLRETAESKDCSVSYIVNECVKAYLPKFMLMEVPPEKRKTKPWKLYPR
jgi:hypothetical protein